MHGELTLSYDGPALSIEIERLVGELELRAVEEGERWAHDETSITGIGLAPHLAWEVNVPRRADRRRRQSRARSPCAR